MATIRSLLARAKADEQRAAWRAFYDRPAASVSLLDDEPAPAPKSVDPYDTTRRLSVDESRRVVAQLRAEGKI